MASVDVNKGIQKVKEAMSRMNKNGHVFCFVNLEALSKSELFSIGEATLKMKAGKDSYMCTGKVICLVSYEECDGDTVSDISTTNNRVNILLNINQSLYGSVYAGYVGYSLEGRQNVMRDTFGTCHPELLDGLFHYLSNDAVCSTSGGKTPVDDNDNTNYIYMNSYKDITPFKTVDEVMKRFYDLMRARGLLLDDEEEDMGALADVAGIEW
jgi:hypothetical protein